MGEQGTLADRTDMTAKTKPRRRWKLWAGLFVLVLLVGAGGSGAGLLWLTKLPDLEEMEAEASPFMQTQDGAALVMAGGTTSEYIPYAEMPETLTEAVIALEDVRFREHGGLDMRSIGRAFVSNLRAGGIVEGGSTITQQLVKISYLTPERTYTRKIHEALLAREIEAKYSKDEILERYLNRVYLGSGARGVGAASRVYFGKPVQDLSLAESALLAASIQIPSIVNPYGDTDRLRVRALQAIVNMEWTDSITADEADAARQEIETRAFTRSAPAYGGWFSDWVAAEAAEQAGGRPVTVRTTLDPELQMQAEAAIAEVLGDRPMQAALVALRPDGSVAAMVGGRDYSDSQFNRAVDAVRQPGSTFKTFVYLAALAEGITPDRTITDQPIDLDGYSPENYGGGFNGIVTMHQSFVRSLNAATVTLAYYIGFEKVAAAARALGIEADLMETPSLALGASGVTLLDLTEAYAAIAEGEGPVEAWGLTSMTLPDGTEQDIARTKPESSDEARRLLAHAPEMTQLLRAVVTSGTGRAVAGVPGAVGKTGTSQESRDALFVGWNDDYTVGVWVGNDDNSPMQGVTGGGFPAQIWAKFLTAAPSTDETSLNTITETVGGTCNVQACSEAYRSFRASDCTFQPYGNRPRQLCER